MIGRLLQFFGYCQHRELSRPFTIPYVRPGAYVICLECGAEFNYDWETMTRREQV